MMDIDVLVDPRCGIIRYVNREPPRLALAAEFRMFTAVLSDTRQFSMWAADSSGAGYSFVSDAAAMAPAIGEAIERYCGNLVSQNLVRTSRTSLLRAGHRVLDPCSLALFAAHQYGSTRFPFVPFNDAADIEWTLGRDITRDWPVYVPASLVWTSYPHASKQRGISYLNPVIQAGLAAGPDLATARWSALCELIERDTVAMCWHGGSRIHEVVPPIHLGDLSKGINGQLHTRFLHFPGEFQLPVLGALVVNKETGYMSLGTACGASVYATLQKALAEAFQLQLFVADLDDPDGPYMRAARDPSSPLKPWRQDRGYLDDCRANLADVVDYLGHLQLYLDPRMQQLFEAELDAAMAKVVDWESIAVTGLKKTTLEDLIDTLHHAGFNVIVVDVTTTDARSAGICVIRMIVPGLYSNSSVGLPFLGGRRMPAQLRALGRERRNLPLPH